MLDGLALKRCNISGFTYEEHGDFMVVKEYEYQLDINVCMPYLTTTAHYHTITSVE